MRRLILLPLVVFGLAISSSAQAIDSKYSVPDEDWGFWTLVGLLCIGFGVIKDLINRNK